MRDHWREARVDSRRGLVEVGNRPNLAKVDRHRSLDRVDDRRRRGRSGSSPRTRSQTSEDGPGQEISA